MGKTCLHQILDHNENVSNPVSWNKQKNVFGAVISNFGHSFHCSGAKIFFFQSIFYVNSSTYEIIHNSTNKCPNLDRRSWADFLFSVVSTATDAAERNLLTRFRYPHVSPLCFVKFAQTAERRPILAPLYMLQVCNVLYRIVYNNAFSLDSVY